MRNERVSREPVYASDLAEYWRRRALESAALAEERKVAIETALAMLDRIQATLRVTAEGLRTWQRNGQDGGAGAGRAGVHPMHAANRLEQIADEIKQEQPCNRDGGAEVNERRRFAELLAQEVFSTARAEFVAGRARTIGTALWRTLKDADVLEECVERAVVRQLAETTDSAEAER